VVALHVHSAYAKERRGRTSYTSVVSVVDTVGASTSIRTTLATGGVARAGKGINTMVV